MLFQIGEHIFDIIGAINFPKNWIKFCFFGEEKSDITVQLVVDKKNSANYYNEAYFYEAIPNLFIDRHTSDYLIADKCWSFFSLHISDFNPVQMNRLLFIAVRSAMLSRQGVFVHAALLNWEGRGILFTGSSGIGKSTQADLWAGEKHARVINGDVTLVKKTGGRYFGFGSPWHGNSPYCENMSVPLCAIIVLEQSVKNSLTRLSGAEMITGVYNNIFTAHWIQDSASLLLDMLDDLLSQVPVFLLQNKADAESVRLLADQLYQNPFII